MEQLQKECVAHQDKEFKAFVVYLNADPAAVAKVAAQTKADKVALCVLKSPDDKEFQGYKINPDPAVKNTVLVYQDRIVSANMVNLKLPEQSKALSQAINVVCK